MPAKFPSVTRRTFNSALLAGLVSRSMFDARALSVGGVRLGIQTYSFHMFQTGGKHAVLEISAACKRLGVTLVELFAQQIEPFPMPSWSWMAWQRPPAPEAPESKSGVDDQRAKLRNWRIHTPDSYFLETRAKFSANGVQIYCYNYSFEADMTDEEIDSGFRHARLLGATYITASSTLSLAQRVLPFATRHQASIGWHNHADLTNPDEICTPASLERLMNMSPLYKINLDIGHFTTAGFNPIAFIQKQHAHITNLHMKDRLKNQGDNRPFGEGDTDIRGVLHLLRDQHYDIPAFVEYEYIGADTPETEIARALKYEAAILRS